MLITEVWAQLKEDRLTIMEICGISGKNMLIMVSALEICTRLEW
jgi:hypothetical protein